MSDWKNLDAEFKKFRLEESPLPLRDEPVTKSCSCPNISIVKPSSSLLEVSSSKLKVKDKRANCLIKPARLKVIGNCFLRKFKSVAEKNSIKEDSNKNKNNNNAKILARSEIEDFTSEAFLKMRISSTSSTSCEINEPSTPNATAVGTEEKDERLQPATTSSSSSSLNCSTQAKLQQQLSSTTEFDSTIDEMSDFLAYHLSLFNHRDNLIDSMYT